MGKCLWSNLQLGRIVHPSRRVGRLIQKPLLKVFLWYCWLGLMIDLIVEFVISFPQPYCSLHLHLHVSANPYTSGNIASRDSAPGIIVASGGWSEICSEWHVSFLFLLGVLRRFLWKHKAPLKLLLSFFVVIYNKIFVFFGLIQWNCYQVLKCFFWYFILLGVNEGFSLKV